MELSQPHGSLENGVCCFALEGKEPIQTVHYFAESKILIDLRCFYIPASHIHTLGQASWILREKGKHYLSDRTSLLLILSNRRSLVSELALTRTATLKTTMSATVRGTQRGGPVLTVMGKQ